MVKRKCEICKKGFEAVTNKKYCDRCSIKGKRLQEKRWRLKNSERDRENHRKWGMENRKKRREIQLRYRRSEIGKEKQRLFRQKHKDKISKYFKKYRKENPEKIKARGIARRKIKIPKNQICQECKKVLATEKHHEDYSKPLKIKFVCSRCHKILDRRLKNG